MFDTPSTFVGTHNNNGTKHQSTIADSKQEHGIGNGLGMGTPTQILVV